MKRNKTFKVFSGSRTMQLILKCFCYKIQQDFQSCKTERVYRHAHKMYLESIPLDNADAGIILEYRVYIDESLANLAGHMNRSDIKEKRIRSQVLTKQLWSGITARWKPLIIAN